MTSSDGVKASGLPPGDGGAYVGAHAGKSPRESVELFRALVENSLDAVSVLNADGLIVYESLAVKRFLGWNPEEHIGRSPFDFVHPDDISKATVLFTELLQSPGATIHDELRLNHKDGSVRYVEVTGQNLLDNAAVAGIVASLRDITESRQVRDELRQSENRLRSLFENATDGIFALDLNGVYTEVNQALVEMHGFTAREELIGKNSFDLVDASELEKAAADLQAVLEAGAVAKVEYNALRADGSRFPCEVSAGVLRDSTDSATGIIGIVRDVTDRREMEESLRVGDERYRLITENVGDVIWTMDMDLNFTYVSSSTERLIGYTPEEEIAIGLAGIMTPASLELAWKTYQRALAAEDSTGDRKPFGSVTVELDHIHKNGSIVPTEVRMTYLRHRDGKPAGIVGITRDITARKQSERALQESEEKYRNVVERASDGITIIQDGVLKFANERSLEVIGYTPAEILGTPMSRYIHPDELPRVLARYEGRMAGQEVDPAYETALLHKDGSRVDVELNAGLTIYEGRPADLVIVRDIREREKAEESLRKSEERYRLLAENVSDVIWTLDLNLRSTYISPSVQHLRGYTAEEAVAIGLERILTPASIYVAAEALAEEWALEETGRADPQRFRRLELEMYCEDGSTIWTEVTLGFLRDDGGRPIGILGVTRDITARRAADEALRESEHSFRSVLENSFDMIYRLDLTTGRYDYVSPSSKSLLGYEPGEFISLGSKHAVSLIHPDDVDRLSEGIIGLMAPGGLGSKTATIGYRIRHKNLGYRWVADNVSVVRDEENAPVAVVGNLRDVTDQRSTENALRESEERLKTLVERAPEAIVAYDFSGTIIDANKKASELIGCPSETLVGKSILELGVIPEDYVPRTAKALAQAAEGVEDEPFEFELLRKDGVRITVEATTTTVEREGKPEVLCIVRDVTERRRMEEALLLKENAIENAVSAIAMSDMDGKITYVNRACTTLWGHENRNELVGKPYWILLKSDAAIDEIAAAMVAEGSWEGELVARRKDGTEVEVQVWSSIVTDSAGEPIQTISSFIDVTDRKKAEKERLLMEQQLQLAGRLAAVGELAAGVAHELNNPLAAVQAFAQFLAGREDLAEDARSDLETIYRESQRASKITGNLLSFARKHKPDRSLVSINEVVVKSLELHDYRLRVNNIEVVRELDPDLPMTMADFHQMQQVFVNIITNAEQAMIEAEAGGRLVVKTQAIGDAIRITFDDNGPGVPKESLKSIFDPFFTTKEVGQGTGLGLSICYGIVQEHGGTIRVSSRPGRGATFVVEIPIDLDGPVATEESDSTHYLQFVPRYF